MSWACATESCLDEKTFAALAKAAGRLVIEFNLQELANTACAFATLKKLDEKLFVAFARAVVQCVRDSDPPELAHMSYVDLHRMLTG